MRFPSVVLAIAGSLIAAPVPDALRPSLAFHASFDNGFNADMARGDRQIYSAASYKSQAQARAGIGDVDADIVKDSGIRRGGALRFRSKNTRALFFRGDRHVSPAAGTFSFWLRLDPQKDLAPGFSDPIQITDKAYNDSAIWVDFTKDDVPRHFRLGVFGSLKMWNPQDLPPDKSPDFLNRLVIVERPPFAADRWTHVVATWSGLNAGGGSASLFLDGKRISSPKTVKEIFEFDPAQLAIRLGVNYTGLMDELTAFDRVLSDAEIALLYRSGAGR